MNHKELCLFFRIPVPLSILHIHSVLVEADEPVYDVLSDIITECCLSSEGYTIEMDGLLERLAATGVEFHPEGIARGLSYLNNFVQHEVMLAVGHANYKQLQAVHVIEPDTVIVTFFSDGKDNLYEQLCNRTRSTRVHPVKRDSNF